MRVKEITIQTSFSGVISEAQYENIRPGFQDSITIEIDADESEHEIREKYRSLLLTEQQRKFELLKNSLKAELIQKQFQKIRFREKDGKQYPSVTSILDWEKDFRITDIELAQYAARGTIIHYMIQKFIETSAWLTLKEVAENGLKEEATILYTGGLKLSIDDCTHEKFFEEFGKDFEFQEFEQPVFNDEYLYCGRYDATGLYKGKKGLIDFKTGSSWDMAQLAAYAKCCDGVEQLIICPVGPTDNKSGIKKPVIEYNIGTHFDRFLKKRSEFQQRFGI